MIPETAPPLGTSDRMASASDAATLYLDLMKKCLTDWLSLGHPLSNVSPYDRARETQNWKSGVLQLLSQRLPHRIHLVKDYNTGEDLATRRAVREEGRDWPGRAETMIGMRRLENIQQCAGTVLAEDIPGDFIETGVFKGGATIFMRAILRAYDITDRSVWVADSFEGLPPVDGSSHALDQSDPHDHFEFLKVSLEDVQANFEKYDLLDSQVKFLKGWFADTLPNAPIERLALLRLDGDMYVSTMDAISALYDKLQPGGFCIVDDYGAVEGCRQAIHDYRDAHGITEPIEVIDWGGVFWRKAR